MPPLLMLPELMYSRSVPIDAIWSCTCCCAPCPSPTVAITAPTPITIPSIVSSERILFRVNARTAIRKIAMNSTLPPLLNQLPDLPFLPKIAEIENPHPALLITGVPDLSCRSPRLRVSALDFAFPIPRSPDDARSTDLSILVHRWHALQHLR